MLQTVNMEMEALQQQTEKIMKEKKQENEVPEFRDNKDKCVYMFRRIIVHIKFKDALN